MVSKFQKYLSLAVLAVAAPAILNGCKDKPPGEVAPPYIKAHGKTAGHFEHPVIYVKERKPPDTTIIGVYTDLETYLTPKEWHMNVQLYIWHDGGWKQIRPQVNWDKSDLAPQGHTKKFIAEGWQCHPGIYMTRWHMVGTDSNGDADIVTEYWPFHNWQLPFDKQTNKDAGTEPKRKEGWSIGHC